MPAAIYSRLFLARRFLFFAVAFSAVLQPHQLVGCTYSAMQGMAWSDSAHAAAPQQTGAWHDHDAPGHAHKHTAPAAAKQKKQDGSFLGHHILFALCPQQPLPLAGTPSHLFSILMADGEDSRRRPNTPPPQSRA